MINFREKAIAFEDKETVDLLRPLYNRYGSEFVESMYEKIEDYDDEYDDTYDSVEVGADDVDSAEELVNATHRSVALYGWGQLAKSLSISILTGCSLLQFY